MCIWWNQAFTTTGISIWRCMICCRSGGFPSQMRKWRTRTCTTHLRKLGWATSLGSWKVAPFNFTKQFNKIILLCDGIMFNKWVFLMNEHYFVNYIILNELVKWWRNVGHVIRLIALESLITCSHSTIATVIFLVATNRLCSIPCISLIHWCKRKSQSQIVWCEWTSRRCDCDCDYFCIAVPVTQNGNVVHSSQKRIPLEYPCCCAMWTTLILNPM